MAVPKDKQFTDWFNHRWRPAAAWVYMVICVLDFALFPIFWSILQAHQGISITQWVPLTLQGAGLFHMAYGAILGVTAWSRGKEKITAMENHYQGSYGINSGGNDVYNEVEGSNENR